MNVREPEWLNVLTRKDFEGKFSAGSDIENAHTFVFATGRQHIPEKEREKMYDV